MQPAKFKLSTPLQVVLPSLKAALGLGETPRIAFVGSGGKTAALFHLAREYASPVIVTSTSRLEIFQTKQADHHFQFDESLVGIIPYQKTCLVSLYSPASKTHTLLLGSKKVHFRMFYH